MVIYGSNLYSIDDFCSAKSDRLYKSLAPEFAQFGALDIGVRTIEVSSPDAVDVLSTPRGGETAFYERRLTVEVWYPADLAGGEPGGIRSHYS